MLAEVGGSSPLVPHSLWNIVIFKGDMNVVKWCKKCGKVTWRIISTIVDRSKVGRHKP